VVSAKSVLSIFIRPETNIPHAAKLTEKTAAEAPPIFGRLNGTRQDRSLPIAPADRIQARPWRLPERLRSWHGLEKYRRSVHVKKLRHHEIMHNMLPSFAADQALEP
jgi:hypothetical protein